MKVSELISELKRSDPDALVVLARDEEGNGFYPLRAIGSENNLFREGEVQLEYLTPELVSAGYTEEDIGDGEKALVLWP